MRTYRSELGVKTELIKLTRSEYGCLSIYTTAVFGEASFHRPPFIVDHRINSFIIHHFFWILPSGLLLLLLPFLELTTMPPRRGKGRPGKKTVVQEEPAPPAAVEEDVASNTSSRPQSPQGMPDLPGPLVPAVEVPAEAAVTGTAAPPSPAAKAKRHKKEPLDLTEDQ